MPDSNRLIPAPVSARALTPPEWPTTSRTYPAAIRRSRCSSGIVLCIGLVPTSFKEANSSLVSGTLRGDKDRDWDRNRAMPSNMHRWPCHNQTDPQVAPASASAPKRQRRMHRRQWIGKLYSARRLFTFHGGLYGEAQTAGLDKERHCRA